MKGKLKSRKQKNFFRRLAFSTKRTMEFLFLDFAKFPLHLRQS